jgi:hypothetical protein
MADTVKTLRIEHSREVRLNGNMDFTASARSLEGFFIP